MDGTEDGDFSLPFPHPGYQCSHGSPKVKQENLQGAYFLGQVIFQQEN